MRFSPPTDRLPGGVSPEMQTLAAERLARRRPGARSAGLDVPQQIVDDGIALWFGDDGRLREKRLRQRHRCRKPVAGAVLPAGRDPFEIEIQYIRAWAHISDQGALGAVLLR